MIAYVVLSVLILFGLIFMSFKLLKMSQKQDRAEKNLHKNPQDYQLHPKLKQQSSLQHAKPQDAKTPSGTAKKTKK